MAAQLIIHTDFLNKVMKQNRAAIRTATSKQINILVEIVFNMLNSKNIRLSTREVNNLRPIHSTLVQLSRTNNIESARKILFKLSKTQLSSFIIPSLVAAKLH